MSEFLSRIKARLETGQHLNSASSEETGWVRAAVVGMDKELGETQDGVKDVATSAELVNGWQTDLVQKMKVLGLGYQDGKDPSLNLAVSGGNSDSDDVSPQSASQRLWETGSLESRIPDGFYSVVPTKSLKARFKIIPSFDEMKCLGGGGLLSDVLVVDASKDQILARLRELVISSVKSIGTSPPLIIKKIAEVVADFYGGPLFEAGAFKHPLDETTSTSPQFLCQIKVGLCRPRALLFKFLGDAVGLHSRLLMGLQLEAVSSSSLICTNPNKHLSNILCLNDVELLVDVMRHPGHLRPFSKKSLIRYHISGAGDSDSADYDSCDSPLEPNSPLFGFPDRLDIESPDLEVLDSPHKQDQRRQSSQSSPIVSGPMHSVILRLPVGLDGKLSPSRSESDLANSYRRRHRRKAMTDEGTATFSLEPVHGLQQSLRRSDTEDVWSFPSSPEHPQARLRTFRRVGPEEGSVSSPEHPTSRIRAPSMLGGGRRQGGEEADCIGISSPEQSPHHLSTAGKHSPIFRRRRERSLSVDVQRDGLNGDFFQTGTEFEFPRVSSTLDVRRPKKRSGALEISDDVVRAVRAMNEAIKLERSRSKSSSDQQANHISKQSFPVKEQTGSAEGPLRLEPTNGIRTNSGSTSVLQQNCLVSEEVVQYENGMNACDGNISPVTSLDQQVRPSSEDLIHCGKGRNASDGNLSPMTSLQRWTTPTSEELVQGGVGEKGRIVNDGSIDLSKSVQHQTRPSAEEVVKDAVEEKGRIASESNISASTLSIATGSSSSGSASITDTSSLILKPPAWLQSPLMPFPEWNIDFKELRIGMRVGIGSFGEVFRGVWKGTEVAIKVMLEQDLTEENTADFCTEISLLSRLRHPNVILFMGACITPPHLSMVTEYMHMGSLYSLVHTTGQGKKISWRRRLKMLRDICRGMMSVQRMNIVHRDLKSANCLVDKHWSVKICDFGLSCLASGAHVQDTAAAGTPEWMAPELLRNDPVTDKCDVFSLGVIMWELCTLKRPWEGVKPMQVVIAVAHQQARLEIPEGLLGKLIADCWAEDPAARPGYDEILSRLHECEYVQG